MVHFQFSFPLYFSLESLHLISTPYSDIPLIAALILLSEGPLFCPLYYTVCNLILLLEGPCFCPLYYAVVYVISCSCQMVCFFVPSISMLLFV